MNQTFSLPTNEDEKCYFIGERDVPPTQARPEAFLPAGTYRVIDGELYRILENSPS